MRVAVMYSGQLRTWQSCKANQERNLVADEIDRYFFSPEEPENTEYKQFVQDHADTRYEPFLHDYDQNKNPITQLHGSLNQWAVRYIGFNLVPTNYTVYCNSRADIELSNKIDFSDYDYPDDTIYIPSGNDHCLGMNDQFVFGSYNTLKKYFSIFTEHHKLFERGLTFHTEFYVTENLKAQGVNIVRIPQGSNIVRLGQPLIWPV